MLKKTFNKLLFDSPAVASGDQVEVSRKDFDFERRLGDGAFGQVWRVKQKSNMKVYAIKQVPKEKVMKMLNQFRREVFIMYELHHPHIIKLYNHFEDEKFFYLIMEIAEGGNLFHKLYREKCFLERNAAQYFREVVLAVEYLHSHIPAIIHRDIKPENILLDKEGRIKLTDFGWSNYYSLDNPTLRYTLCGTLEYLPPEIVTETGHNTGADIWCLGILLFEMLTGSTPFASKGKDQMLTSIANAKAKFPHSMPPMAKDLISKMIEKDPNKRISAKEIKNHAWLLEHPPIRETITQECLPKLLPSLEEINKVTQNLPVSDPKPPASPTVPATPKPVTPKKPIKNIGPTDQSTEETFEESLIQDQSINLDNSREISESFDGNEFRKTVSKLKQQVVVKSDCNSKIKNTLQETSSKLSEYFNKAKCLEEKISEKKKELNSITAIEKEMLCKIADSNIELEKINGINISAVTEKINEKNSELLIKTTQGKQLKNKYENLKTNCQKALQEFNEKEKILIDLNSNLKKNKEKASLSNIGKKSEITELANSAEVLKSRLNNREHPAVRLGRQERSAANEIMNLIKSENQKLETFSRLKLQKDCNQLEEKVSEKEQELAEAKIYHEDEKSRIMQRARSRKDEILRAGKRKSNKFQSIILSQAEEAHIKLKELLDKARKNENLFYTDQIDIHKSKQLIKVKLN
jgi:serine/threonine protein kinase